MSNTRFCEDLNLDRSILDDFANGEEAVSLKSVCHDPRLKIDGKARSIGWAYRAVNRGVRGKNGELVALEFAIVGSARVTSASAVKRFLYRLNQSIVNQTNETAAAKAAVKAQLAKPRNAVERELAAAGL